MINYRFFKLTNGDGIICGTDDDCKNLYDKKSIFVIDPVIVQHVRIPRGNFVIDSFMLAPWVNVTKDSVVEIRSESIIAVTEVKDSVLKNYLEFVDNTRQEVTAELNDINNDTVETKLADALESILSNMESNEDENEDEEDYYRFPAPTTRSIH